MGEYVEPYKGAGCQVGEQCSPFFFPVGDKKPSEACSLTSDWCPVATGGHWASLIYSGSALVIKGCEGDPREQEFVQKECLWKGIYLWFTASRLVYKRCCRQWTSIEEGSSCPRWTWKTGKREGGKTVRGILHFMRWTPITCLNLPLSWSNKINKKKKSIHFSRGVI